MSGTNTPGFFSQGIIGNTELEAQGTNAIASTTGEVQSAQFGQSFSENPASRLYRWVDNRLSPYPRTMQADEANETFGIEGRLRFDQPVTMDVARDLHDHHRASIRREDVIARRADGIGTGAVARFGTALAASLLDPLNVASAFIPFLGEARIAGMLGQAAAGAGGRALVRGIEGAGAGLAGAAALEPLQYWLSQQDKDDYTMGHSAMNLAFGTVMGGFLHGGIGALRDRRGLPAWSPESHEAALRQSTAALVDNTPVNAAAAIEFTAARTARQELEDYIASRTRLTQQADDAILRSDTAVSARTRTADRLTALRRETDTIREEIAEARGRLPEPDTVTAARLAEVDAELGGIVPASRRADLEAERRLLTEGQNPRLDLDAARTEQEIAGLTTAAERAERRASRVEAALARQEDAADQAGRLFDSRASALAAREALTEELAERSIRRLAGRIGAPLADGEAAELASRLMRADSKTSTAVLDDILNSISNRAVEPWARLGPEAFVTGAGERALTVMRAAEQRAERSLREGLGARGNPADAASQRATNAAAERAPKADGDMAAQITEAEKATKEMADAMAREERAFAAQEKAAGRQAPEPDPELKLADEWAKEGEAMAKAHEAAALCAVGR